MFCCELLCVHPSFAITLMGKRESWFLLRLSSWCLVIVVWLFLLVPQVCLQFVIVVLPDHTRLLFLKEMGLRKLMFLFFTVMVSILWPVFIDILY